MGRSDVRINAKIRWRERGKNKTHLELPQGNVDGDTTLALGLEVVKHPGVLERGLAHLGGLLLVLLDGTLVNATALVDQVTSRGRLAGIDVADDHERNVNLSRKGRGKGGAGQ